MSALSIIFEGNFDDKQSKKKKTKQMTLLGIYLYRKPINKAEVSRKTKLSPSRLSKLTLNEKAVYG
jgi:hypothetical protein